jgi:predicted nucleic acid-binding protein
MLVAIDTSVLIGVLDARDVWHGAALRLHDALLAMRLPLVYFDCVLAEASSTVARRLREQRRESELPGLLEQLRAEFPPERLTWLFPDVPRLYGQIMEQMHQSAGELNFNDGLIALACRERQIRLLASFDGDFDTLTWVTRVATPDDVAAALAAPPPPAAGTPESPEPM